MIRAGGFARSLGAMAGRLRGELGYTQEQLAAKAHVHRDTLSRFERGESGARTTLAMVARVAAGLGVSLATMIGQVELSQGPHPAREALLAAQAALEALDPGRLRFAIAMLRGLGELE